MPISTQNTSVIYIVYEEPLTNVILGYYLEKELATQAAKGRAQEQLELSPGSWCRVIVRQVPLGKMLTNEAQWLEEKIIWRSE